MNILKLLSISAFALAGDLCANALDVEHLRTMHLNNPIGIDQETLTFSWNLKSDKRSIRQQSYNIVIASDREMNNVVWSSGYVDSSESVNVKAIGFQPAPTTRYYWTVSVIDNSGESATNTVPAYFETGLMNDGWSGANWIRKGDVYALPSTPDDKPDFSTVKNYSVEADFEIERIAAGIIWGAVDHNNYYMWQFNIEKSPSMFRPHRWSDGNPSCLDEKNVTLERNRNYHLRIDVVDNGTTANTYLDGIMIDSRSGSFPCGELGIRSAKAENEARYYETSYYDDFKVIDNDGKTLFEDHFDNRDNFDNGNIVGGRLRVEGECYAWQKNFIETPDVTEYTFEGKFTIDQVAAGICFAGTDDSHYYMWQFNIEKSQPMFRPHRWNGGAACLAEIPLSEKVNIVQGREYSLRIEVSDNGSKARTYLNNVLIDERDGEFAYGRVGIRAAQGENNTRTYERSYYDNFIMRDESGNVLFDENFDNPGIIQFSEGEAVDNRFMVGAYSDIYSWGIDNSRVNPNLHYAIEADMTIVKDNAAIIFGYRGSVNYCMWAVNTVENQNPFIRRHIYDGSSTPLWSDSEPINIPKSSLIGSEHHLKIEVHGNVVTTYIDNILVDSFNDYSGSITAGHIGFRSNKGDREDERAYWDNIKVTEYNPDGSIRIVMDENFENAANEFDDAELILIGNNHKLNMYSRNGDSRILENKTSGTPVFRKDFTLPDNIVSARLYSSALGNYNVFINGQRVGTIQDNGKVAYDELMPGWTDYRKKVFYCTHDVTSLLTVGDNVIGAQLSSGWWGGDIAHGIYGSPELAFMCKLVITLLDGTEMTVISDDSWNVMTEGPVKRGDIYHGETYDARHEGCWTETAYNDFEWHKAAVDNQFEGIISAYEGPAVRIRENLNLSPQSITVYNGINDTGTTYGEVNVIATSSDKTISLKKGETAIFDFGQNFAGWVDINVKGQRGTIIKMRFAEMLNDNGDAGRGDDGPGGSLYTINLRNAKCLLKYTLNGNENGESYHPSTTFFGFRYCEITATEEITLTSVIGQVVGSDTEEGSFIKVNNDAVNQLYSNILWGQRSNFLSVPTDCPQRDERLGWTADTQIFSVTAAYNADVQSFYHKWMGDMRDSQREDGAYPDVAPYCWVGYGQAAWGDAGIILPWNVYTMYGDKSIIEENIESMERYMEYVARQEGDGYKYNGSGADSYGDWVSFEPTDRRFVSVAYYGYMADIMSKMCAALSNNAGDTYAKKSDAYSELLKNIKTEFSKRYIRDGRLTETSQCALLLALRFNLLPDDETVENAKQMLRTKIESNGNKLSTGFVGTGIINQTLSEAGLNDLAYTLLLQRECPSWLYSVDQGATTIWERWDSYTREKGFHNDISMNSFNHYAYGAVAEWMYRYMAGIAPNIDEPGFKDIILCPMPDTRTNHENGQHISDVSARFASPYGNISSCWTTTDNGMIYSVTVPANTTATVYYPLAEGQSVVFEGSVNATKAEGVEYITTDNGKAVFRIGSGTYVFSPDGISNIDDVKSDRESIVISPNPATDTVTIHTSENIDNVDVYGISGIRYKFPVDNAKLNVSTLAPGVYIMVINTESGPKTARLIKR